MCHKRIKFYKELKTSYVSDIDCWMVAFKFQNSSLTYQGPLLDFIFEVSVFPNPNRLRDTSSEEQSLAL